jgi:hypothetical protein
VNVLREIPSIFTAPIDGALKENKIMLLKLMGTLALLSVNAAPHTSSKQVAPKVVAKAGDVKPAETKSTGTQVAKAEDKKAEPAKTESTDGGTPAPKKGGGKK